MHRVAKKLNLMKKTIRDFSKDNYSGIEKRVAEAHSNLLTCQNTMLSQPNQMNAMAEIEATTHWRVLALAKEVFYCQRTSISWLALGNSNTSFFHRIVKSRTSFNMIHYLIDADENRIVSQKDILDHCVNYFTLIWGKYYRTDFHSK